MKNAIILAGLALLILAGLARGDGIGWRGDGTGRYPQATPSSTWSGTQGKNVLWQAEVGKGQSSPVPVGERVFITAEPDLLRCLDSKSGKVLWTRAGGDARLPAGTALPKEKPPTAPNCGYTTPTPVTDAARVYANYGTGIVVCYDMDGNLAWVRYVDLPQESEYGRSASPVLVGGKLLVSIGALVALDPKTGQTLWQAKEAVPSFGTPAAARIGGADVVFTPLGDCVRVSDGKVLARKLASLKYTSPIVHDGVVYFVGPGAVAFRLPAKMADAIGFERTWDNDDVEGEFFASPVLHEGILYCAGNDGILYALDAASGKLIWKQELEIASMSGKPGPAAGLYPSLTLAGPYLLVSNDAGQTLVLAPGREYKEISRCNLGKGSAASPAADGKRLLLRGATRLLCIGSP